MCLPYNYMYEEILSIRIRSKIEKVPRGIQGEKSSKYTVSSGNMVSR